MYQLRNGTPYSDSTPPVTYTYDDYNRTETRTDGMGLYQYGYDANSRMTSIDGPWANDTVTFQYNGLGQLYDLTPQGGQSITYGYDTLGRLATVQPGSNTFTYGYTGVNPLIQSLTRPNGSFTTYLYNDPLKRLTDVINKNSSQQVINSYNYTYNSLDMRGSETITNGNPITTFQNEQITYDYNDLDQLLSSTSPVRTYTYDYDGNMTKAYTPAGYVLNMTYDAENRLKTAEYTGAQNKLYRTEYYYSGDNLRAQVKKFVKGVLSSDTRFVRAGFLPVQERDGSNNVTREYTWGQDYGGGIGGLLNLRQGGADYAYLYDGKGNVSALINSAQSVVAAYTYAPFGELMRTTGTFTQPYMFSTKEYDTETGLSYYGYRFYSPALGKWMTRDPLGDAGGVNLYEVVGNNVVNWIDPLGLAMIDSGGFLQLRNRFLGWAPEWLQDFLMPLDPVTPMMGVGQGDFGNLKIRDILKKKKGCIKNAPLPKGSPNWDDILDKTWDEVADDLKNTDAWKTIKKLLTKKEYDK